MRAVEFLRDSQSTDGCWREYSLPPGPSEAWTTSLIGFVLGEMPRRDGLAASLGRAAEAVWSLRQQGGWGYNRSTAPDADSTAWAVRFLEVAGRPASTEVIPVLEQFVGPDGAATFSDAGRFGSWACGHPDVTPVVGLAMLSLRAGPEIVCGLRQSCLHVWDVHRGWPSFWWTTDTYALAWNLIFLQLSGGIPDPVRIRSWDRLVASEAHSSPFEAAHTLLAAVALGMADSEFCRRSADDLLALRQDEHNWPSSAVLRVPAQRGIPGADPPTYADGRCLVSTVVAVYALSRYLLATEHLEVA